MKDLVRISVLALVIVLGVFAVRCTGSKPAETAVDSTTVTVDSVATDTVAAQ